MMNIHSFGFGSNTQLLWQQIRNNQKAERTNGTEEASAQSAELTEAVSTLGQPPVPPLQGFNAEDTALPTEDALNMSTETLARMRVSYMDSQQNGVQGMQLPPPMDQNRRFQASSAEAGMEQPGMEQPPRMTAEGQGEQLPQMTAVGQGEQPPEPPMDEDGNPIAPPEFGQLRQTDQSDPSVQMGPPDRMTPPEPPTDADGNPMAPPELRGADTEELLQTAREEGAEQPPEPPTDADGNPMAPPEFDRMGQDFSRTQGMQGMQGMQRTPGIQGQGAQGPNRMTPPEPPTDADGNPMAPPESGQMDGQSRQAQMGQRQNQGFPGMQGMQGNQIPGRVTAPPVPQAAQADSAQEDEDEDEGAVDLGLEILT